MKVQLMAKTTVAIIVVLLMASGMLTLSEAAVPRADLVQPGLTEADMPAGVSFGWGIRLPTGVTPDVTTVQTPYICFRPNPIGVGQTLLITMWSTPSHSRTRKTADNVLTITKPDGTKDVFNFQVWTSEMSSWMAYTPGMVGTYKIKWDMPGQYYPAGEYYDQTSGGTWVISWSEYLTPFSSAEYELTVQEELVLSWPSSPLPTDYWTRPVAAENREWWPVLGSYPGTGYVGGGPVWDAQYAGNNPYWSTRYNFHPYVLAPNSAHIVWKRQGAVSGITGGLLGQIAETGGPGSPSVAYQGRCYQTYTKPGVGSVAACYDLRTGQIYYEIPTAQGGITPTVVSYVPVGAQPTRYVQSVGNVELLSISGGRLYKINPWTGAANLNVSIAPLTGSGGTYYMHPFVLGIQDLGVNATTKPGGRYRLINWTTAGSNTQFAERIASNTSYALSSLPSLIDFNAGVGANVVDLTMPTPVWGVAASFGFPGNTKIGIRVVGYDLKTGGVIWNVTSDDSTYSGSAMVADHGKVAVLCVTNMQGSKGGYFKAWDLSTGKVAWTGDSMDYPLGESAFGAYSISSAYGKIIYSAYQGLTAWDWETGKISWCYRANALAHFETPYATNGTEHDPFDSENIIADGKVYSYNSEHTEVQPLSRGWGAYCVNVTTGELIWRIALPGSTGVIHDGYSTISNSRDGYMYVIGRGKSATTVTAPDVSVPLGTAFTIKGTVLDMSPAQTGTPCVSKESMTLQMEYLHKQMPIDGIWHNETIKGVPVTLTAIDSNGTVISIGTTTTNGYGGTFGMAWTPTKQDTYTILASFAADDSYGSSMATTQVTVGAAPEQINIPEQIAPADYTMTIVGVGIAVIIAVAIVGLLIFLGLRKR